MRRRLFAFAAALSLVLCIASIVLCCATRDSYALAVPAKGSRNGVWIGRGVIVMICKGHISGEIGLLSLAFLFLPFPIIWVLGIKRSIQWLHRANAFLDLHVKVGRSVRDEGVCSTCGYDLRATPERCPECGAVPAGVTGSK